MKIILQEVDIKTSDGEYLNGNMYLPVQSDKVPVIIMRTPYGKHNINTVFDPYIIVKKGFALLVQNVRGRYESTGIFLPFENEKEDGKTTVEWVKEQNWSNGHIYSLGVSYEGFTAMMMGGEEGVVAISPIMSSGNIRRDWFYENHCLKQAFVQSWSHSFAFTDEEHMLQPSVIDYIQFLSNDIAKLYKRKLTDFPVNNNLPYYKHWINENDDKYWNYIDKKTNARYWDASGYYVSGWYDIFCEGTIKEFLLAVNRSSKPQKLVIGPWSHTEIFKATVGDVDYGIYNFEKYSSTDILDWFSKIEKGEDVVSEIKLFIMGKNKWYSLHKQPTVIERNMFLAIYTNSLGDKERRLQWEESKNNEDEFTYKGNDLVPTCGGRCIDAIPKGLGGPKNQELIENREDVLVYTSERLTKELCVIGKIKIQLVCESTLEQMDYAIKIVDVDQDNCPINILDSVLRIKQNANKKGSYELTIGTIAYSFLAGHRVRCEISSSNFPRINVQEEMINRQAMNKIYCGDIKASFIKLPEVEI